MIFIIKIFQCGIFLDILGRHREKFLSIILSFLSKKILYWNNFFIIVGCMEYLGIYYHEPDTTERYSFICNYTCHWICDENKLYRYFKKPLIKFSIQIDQIEQRKITFLTDLLKSLWIILLLIFVWLTSDIAPSIIEA